MNLFVGSMLILVLAENLLLLYLGWEGVGLCSYLLIGFWYKDQSNGYAARKAFIVTRVGDVAFALGLFLLYTNSGTLRIPEIMQQASQASGPLAGRFSHGDSGSLSASWRGCWKVRAGAPPDMAARRHGRSHSCERAHPCGNHGDCRRVSHCADKCVVYSCACCTICCCAYWCGNAADCRLQRPCPAETSSVFLAYSTISQIGYMFMALGVGAWSAAIFHFMVHAFFKALLFLGAGIVIESLDHERDMFKMGGLRRQLPVVFWTFLIGSASLSAIPLITAGFYSKDLILWEAWSSPSGSRGLWLAGLTGAFITSLYTFRMVFLTFFGKTRATAKSKPALTIYIPLITLAVLSIIGGLPEIVSTTGGLTLFSSFIGGVLPSSGSPPDTATEIMFKGIGATASLAGLYFAYLFFLKRPALAEELGRSGTGAFLSRFWFSGWGFDWLYDSVIVRPYVWVARLIKDDVFDFLYAGIAWYSELSNAFLGRTQSGNVRWYAAVIAAGVILMLALVVFL